MVLSKLEHGYIQQWKPQKILTLVCFSSISTGKFPEHPANPKNNGYQYNWDKNFLMVYVFASVCTYQGWAVII